MHDIATALAEVRTRIARAAGRAGRSPDDIRLVVVTKTRSAEEIAQAAAAGATDLGENYVQELVAKREALVRLGFPDLRWHMIGHLQRNKVRFLAPFCALIHAVDSSRLGAEISARAQAQGRRQAVLVEVNIAAEATKFGLAPEEVAAVAEGLAALPGVELQGLMAMVPYGAPEAEARERLAAVRELAEQLAPSLPPGAMSQLSMGMSQDFEVAVEEGATLVRVGTAIFGRRDQG
jgi:pyridoxal phosphate enzyme (YggS family)